MIREIQGDLFDHTEGRVPVHCIAADHRMGAGIAVPMAKKYNLHALMDKEVLLRYPRCYYIGGVMNLVTKKLSYHKPSYVDFEAAVGELRKQCVQNNITKLVMPRIGCGLDRLEWDRVLPVLERELSEFDVLVCVRAPERHI